MASGLSGSQSPGGATGTCPVCLRVGIKLTADGVLYNHGPRAAPCKGVGKVPISKGGMGGLTVGAGGQTGGPGCGRAGIVGSVPLPSSGQTPPAQLTPGVAPSAVSGAGVGPTLVGPQSAAAHPAFTAGQSPPLIKWIPRAARQNCATLLTKLINAVLKQPSAQADWERLFAFGRLVLTKPPRGGTQRNLSNIIMRRCGDFFGSGCGGRKELIGKGVVQRVGGASRDSGSLANLARAVAVKLEESNYKGAVRLVCSEDTIAPHSAATLQALRDKNPPGPSDRRAPPAPDSSAPSYTADESAIRKALFSFPPGSSGGPDGLTAQHLRDMVACEGEAGSLLTAITSLTNRVMSGGVPESSRPIFFGGRLVALNKKDGGIRPIVVGSTFRRLASKVVNNLALQKMASVLSPIQLGGGVPRGVEAAVHATRRYLQQLPPDHVVVKLDFRNAFNSIRRDTILEASRSALPEAYAYIHSAYAAHSALWFGEAEFSSEEGVHQGDPLGPLLFCLAIHPLLLSCRSELRVGYLDDVSLGGDLSTVAQDVDILRCEAAKLGLTLNDKKCEVICSDASLLPSTLPVALRQFCIVGIADATLLGSPLSPSGATDQALAAKVNNLKVAAARLQFLHAHDALVILKHSLSIPKMLHILRTSFCGNHQALQVFDAEVRDCLSITLNVALDEPQWLQASLPVKEGGLGIRRSGQLAPSAFLASATGSESLVLAILPPRFASVADPTVFEALRAWESQTGQSPPAVPPSVNTGSQRVWDKCLIDFTRQALLDGAQDDYTKARLLAAAAPHAGEWLNAPPITAVGLRMSDSAIRVAAGLRLGANLCAPHTCPCGATVDARGAHGLACQRSAGRHLRHALINDIVCRALGRADVAAVKEPAGLVVGSGLRPDGVSLVPWARGKCVAWDATTPDTLAASHLPSTKDRAGSAASHAAMLKTQKYSALAATHIVVPIAVETLGPWDEVGLSFIRELGRRTSIITGDPRETSFVLQRISVAVQRGNAASCLGSLPSSRSDEEA
jgi:hypothetical protein